MLSIMVLPYPNAVFYTLYGDTLWHQTLSEWTLLMFVECGSKKGTTMYTQAISMSYLKNSSATWILFYLWISTILGKSKTKSNKEKKSKPIENQDALR